MVKKAAVLVLTLGIVGHVGAKGRDSLARFDGGIGVSAVSNVSGTANADGSFPDRIVIVDIFKEYPIGNSRSWLPKAIEEDGLGVETLLETSQARVIEVRAPERAARLSARRP